MPFALVLIGLVLIVTGAKDTYRQLGSELVTDFTGQGNFTFWLASLGAVGALGYIPPLKTFSRLFMVLIIVAMLLSNKGFFANFSAALNAGPETITPTPRDTSGTTSDTGNVSPTSSLSLPASTDANAQANFEKVIAGVSDIAKVISFF